MSIAVIGAGSWGTVLSKILADNGHDVVLWARNPEKAALIEQTRINNDYLPDLTLSPSIHVTHDFQWVGTAEVLVFVVPSKGMGTVCSDLSRVTKGKGKILLTCTKGFSRETGKLMSDVLECLLSINFMKFCTIIRKSLLRPMILCHDRGRKSGTNY